MSLLMRNPPARFAASDIEYFDGDVPVEVWSHEHEASTIADPVAFTGDLASPEAFARMVAEQLRKQGAR